MACNNSKEYIRESRVQLTDDAFLITLPKIELFFVFVSFYLS